MKGKVLITISDMNGSKQYTPFELFKHFAIWIFIALVVIFAIDLAIFKMFAMSNNEIENLTQTPKNKMEIVSKN
jgi:uncharacterized protein HemY